MNQDRTLSGSIELEGPYGSKEDTEAAYDALINAYSTLERVIGTPIEAIRPGQQIDLFARGWEPISIIRRDQALIEMIQWRGQQTDPRVVMMGSEIRNGGEHEPIELALFGMIYESPVALIDNTPVQRRLDPRSDINVYLVGWIEEIAERGYKPGKIRQGPAYGVVPDRPVMAR